MTDNSDLNLLERLAAEGKPARMLDDELALAKDLEKGGLLFLVGAYAVITPKGRRLLADLAQAPKRNKPPFRFSD